MLKLESTQFIQIKIDNKAISGTCKEKDYLNWIEGNVSSSFSSALGHDGAEFDSIHMMLRVSSDTKDLFEKYLLRGEKGIDITIVHRGSDKIKQSYEVQKTECKDCRIDYLNFEITEYLVMNIIFKCMKTIGVTFLVENSAGTGHDKIGPITYDMQQKTLI
ncbi:hypothetical protein [Providencia rettgeri]|uniref:hypothetical protein n=1 Tax=Providencia rettgeri TaxID=587 RepID=UPI00301AD8CA